MSSLLPILNFFCFSDMAECPKPTFWRCTHAHLMSSLPNTPELSELLSFDIWAKKVYD